MYVNFVYKWQDVQFKVDSERQIFEKLFMAILFILREEVNGRNILFVMSLAHELDWIVYWEGFVWAVFGVLFTYACDLIKTHKKTYNKAKSLDIYGQMTTLSNCLCRRSNMA